MNMQMKMSQVIFVLVMLMDGIRTMKYATEETKAHRMATFTLSQNNEKSRNPQQLDKQVHKDAEEDEDKKTLAQQVADGKYGLIQTELFSKPVKRPGIISYEVNPEVPKDNVNNLGGLMPEEIWLAENHLLVLKGGGFGGEGKWPAIDNYVAPRRQVKIPQNPKVPPPFPVQLTDGGPIEFIKARNSSTVSSMPFIGGGLYTGNKSHPGNLHGGNGFNPFPFLLPLPPPVGAFLSRPENLTELDEDDPSIYYPPPYDFVFPKDNSSFVPAGPLVPGIVIPPPPNFFGLLEKKTNRKKPNTIKSRPSSPQSNLQRTSTPAPYHSTTKKLRPVNTTFKPYKQSTTVTTESYKQALPHTTISPNEILNTLPPNTPVGNWIPIPAPRPFYISLKPIKIEHDNHQSGWVYYNHSESRKPQLYSTDPYYVPALKSVIKQNSVPIYVENYSETPKYYYYDTAPDYETNTLAPPIYLNPQVHDRIKYLHSPLEYFIKDKYKPKNKKLPSHTTKKTPIYEYSYSAPGYDNLKTPKIGTNILTTQKPYIYQLSTANYFTTQRPTYDYNVEYPAAISFDDINKKYYNTFFGQKLNHEITTPVPNYRYDSTSAKTIRYNNNVQNNSPLVQYQDNIYYRTTDKPKSFPHLYRAPSQTQYGYSYHSQDIHPGHPLHSDLRVNYRNPLPEINPLAEYIENYNSPTPSQTTPVAPALSRAPSLISYQLPGSGGHFYFLTPKAVK